MSKKRKVNAPVREKKKQEAEAKRKRVAKKQGSAAADYKPQSNAGLAAEKERKAVMRQNLKLLGIILGIVLVCVVGLVFGLKHLTKERPVPTPWADYQDRVKVTPSPSGTIREYAYNEREVPAWIDGVKNKNISQADFDRITALAARWLAADDAST
ncbi:MAG: hypothetical protein AAF585_15955 [Verrucomicrobiota bacterium]